MNSRIVLRLALLLTVSCRFSLLVAGDSVTNTPTFSALVIPEPPFQHNHWKASAMDLPTNLVSSVQFLFDLGLPDPRGCPYREFEAATGSEAGHARTMLAHGWILPGRSGRPSAFAISWDGLIYPAVKVGKKASLKEDMKALLRADELWRKSVVTNPIVMREPQVWHSPEWPMSQTNMTAIKIAFLMRLGQGKLAGEYWPAWAAVRNWNGTRQDATDPFTELAAEWVFAQFRRGVGAFMRTNDALALTDLRQLNRLWPALEKETSRRGFWRPQESDGHTPPPYFAFLSPVPELLRDEERRALEPPHPSVLPSGLGKSPDKPKRIAALISDLDQMSEAQFIFPGGVWVGQDPLVLDLIAEGDDAVDPLLDCLEKDHRLTRSADSDHNFQPYRIVPVQQCAQTALDGILKIHFDSPDKYRAYWKKYRSTPELERWYQTLIDDNAGRQQWMQAARNILARTDGKTFYLWRNAPVPDATNGYTYVAESLRSKSAPSIEELFFKRALEIAPTHYTDSDDGTAFVDAADLGLMSAEWDITNASSALKQIIQRCPALFRDQPAPWITSNPMVLEEFARLTVALAKTGDTSGLDLYAKWIKNRKLSDLEGALPVALLPLGDFPNHPSIKDASTQLFRPENGQWLSRRHYDLLSTRLLENAAFRLLILSALTNKAGIGAIVSRDKNQFEYTNDDEQGGGILIPDTFAPRIGEVISFRVCDDAAHRLSRIEGLPTLQLYWPEEKREEAIASIIAFLRENGDRLKLKPAGWPISD